MKVAREGTIVSGALLALCWLNFGAVAFETAPAEAPPAISNSILPEFLDSSRLPQMQDAWRSSVTREDSSSAETPAVANPLPPGGEQPVRRRAEELSGRFSDGASAGNLTAKSAKPAAVKELPTSLSEAAMPGGTSVMSHMGAPVAVPPGTDDTTTATLPDVATDKPPTAETPPDPTTDNAANATWLKVGLPPLPVRSPKTAKAHAKAIGAKSRGDKTKEADKATSEKPAGSKSTAGKIATAKAAEKDDEDEKPVRQFRAPTVTRAAPPQPRLDPGRKEVFPPYLGAYGLTSQAR